MSSTKPTNGRDLQIKRGSKILAVVNTKTIAIDNTPVDVTGDDADGFIRLLERPGTRQISMDVGGFTTDDELRDVAILGVGLMAEYTIEYLKEDGSGEVIYSIKGDFFMSNFTETGSSDGALEFTATLASSGKWEKVVTP